MFSPAVSSAQAAPKRLSAARMSASKAPKPRVAALPKLGLGAMVAGLAAAQLGLAAPGPALAQLASPQQPAVDMLASADVTDVITEVEDVEIPALEAKLGQLANVKGASPAAVRAAQSELEAIEREAARVAEEEASGDAPANVAAQTSGILSNLNSLKSLFRGL